MHTIEAVGNIPRCDCSAIAARLQRDNHDQDNWQKLLFVLQ
jgi:hypothetical protein